MKIKLLFIQDGKINRKLYQVKFIKDLFGLGLKEAKDLDLIVSIHRVIDNSFPKNN